VLGFVAQAVVLGLFVVMRGDALLVIAAAEPFVFLALLAQCGEGRAGRLAREHHGRYVVPSTPCPLRASGRRPHVVRH